MGYSKGNVIIFRETFIWTKYVQNFFYLHVLDDLNQNVKGILISVTDHMTISSKIKFQQSNSVLTQLLKTRNFVLSTDLWMKSSQVQDVYCVWWSQKFKGVLAKYVLTTQILLKLIFVGIGRTEYDLWTQNLMGKNWIAFVQVM